MRRVPDDGDSPGDVIERAVGAARRAAATGDEPTVRRAGGEIRSAIRGIGHDDVDLPWAIACLADVLALRFELTGEPAVLDESIAMSRRSRALRAPDDAQEPGVSVNLAQSLLRRFELTGREADLSEAMRLLRGARNNPAVPEHVKPFVYATLSAVLLRVFEREGRRADIDEAIAAGELARRAGDREVGAVARLSLGGALVRRFELTGDVRDVRRGVRLLRVAVGLSRPGSPTRLMALTNLATGLLRRYEHEGGQRTLDEGVRAARAALALASAGHPWFGPAASALVQLLRFQYAAHGRSSDLDAAVAAARAGLDATPPANPERDAALTCLADVLRTRYEALGGVEDLREAVRLFDDAVGVTAVAGVGAAPVRGNHGIALLRLSEIDQDGSLRDRAVRQLEAAVDAATGIHRGVLLGNLGVARCQQADETRDPEQHERAVETLKAAVACFPPRHLAARTYRHNLAVRLLRRYGEAGQRTYLDTAITLLDEVTAGTPKDAESYAIVSYALGSALLLRAADDESRTDAVRAVDVLRRGASSSGSPAQHRAWVCWAWASAATSTGDLRAGLRGYQAAVGLLDLVAWRGLDSADQERLLTRFDDLARDAAACALALGEPGRAVELLEQGRGVLLQQALDRRSGYDELRRQAPELADRLAAVSAALDRPDEPVPDDPSLVEVLDARRRDERTSLARERDAVVARIRAMPGLAGFLRAPKLADVRPRRGEGPVVVVCVADLRCDAIIVTDGDTLSVALPDLSAEEVSERAAALATVVDDLAESGPDAARAVLTDTLAWLWRTICGPVLRALGWTDLTAARRLWWCPTGQLALLPLHAAGEPGRPGALDLLISSYTPTLRLLRRLRDTPPAAPEPTGARMLVILPDAPDQVPLPAAGRAAHVVEQAVTTTTTLAGPDATAQRLLAELPRHRWLHFAGHGA